jgi:hypothetical protein
VTTQQEAIQAVIEKRRGAIRGEEQVDEEQVETEAPAEEEASAAEVEEGEDAGEDSEPVAEALAEEEEEEGEEAESAEEAEAREFYAGRYLSREETERGLGEKDAYIQRLEAERNQWLQQAQPQMQPEPEPVQIDPAEWMEWAQEALTQVDPMSVWQAAYNRGGEAAADVAIRAMYASEDPEARRWATQWDYYYANAVEDARRAPEVEQQQRQQAQQSFERETYEARAEMQRRYPDYEQVEPEIEQYVASLPDGIERSNLQALATEFGAEGKLWAYEQLYRAVRANAPERLVEAKVTERKKSEERSRAKKISATVATATASPERTPLTEAEREEIAYKNRIRKAAGLPLLEEDG